METHYEFNDLKALLSMSVSNNANLHRIGLMEGPEKLLTFNKDNIPVVRISIILMVEF